MTTIWVLIMLSHAGFSNANGNSLAIAEFTSKERCEKAGQLIKMQAKEEPRSSKLVTFVCTEK